MLFLCGGIQHVFNENAIAGGGVVDEDVCVNIEPTKQSTPDRSILLFYSLPLARKPESGLKPSAIAGESGFNLKSYSPEFSNSGSAIMLP
jgi:hypothetical protein